MEIYYHNNKSDATKHDLRSRLWFAGQVNDSWKYTAMVENVQNFDNNIGDETTSFQRAWVDGRIGGAKVTAGRFQPSFGGSVVFDNRMDGVRLAYGNAKANIYGYYGKPSGSTADYDKNTKKGGWKTPYKKMYGVGVAAKFGKVGVDAGYDVFKDATKDHGWDGAIDTGLDDNKIFNVGVKFDIAKDTNLGFRYLHTSEKIKDGDSKNGYVVDLGFKGAKAAKPGSWGIAARYMDVGGMIPMAYVDDNSPATVGGDYATKKEATREGWKGYEVKANYTFAKNMIGTIAYYDWKGKVTDNKNRTFGAHLMITF